MYKGFDTCQRCDSIASQIKSAGFEFVGRYYASCGTKTLTCKEAQMLSKLNINIVSLWEDDSTDASSLSYACGVHHGTAAYRQAMLIGQPAGTPIYFTVDDDAQNEIIAGSVSDYFHGIAVGFAAIAGNRPPAYSIGIYGSGLVCGWLLDHSLVTHTWLSNASGWAGYNTFKRWTIKQHTQSVAFDPNIKIDTNDAIANYGGFKVMTP
jgi:hypothetical protein